ncbi:MAG: UbiH/UbiF family hydroxylase [Pseudomonadota bacterium]
MLVIGPDELFEKMMKNHFDVAVVGAGPIGNTSALLLTELGLSVALIGPDISAAETRTTALLNGTVQLFKTIGAWPEMAKVGQPLASMRLVDDTGRLLRAPTVTFKADEIDLPYFGMNVPVSKVNAALATRVAESDGIARFPHLVSDIDLNGDAAALKLQNDETVFASFVVAADGRESPCRKAAGIDVRVTDLPQSAIATSFSHSLPHNDISTEFHKKEGPFTVVPMPGEKSALVWMVRPERADKVLSLGEDALIETLEENSHGILGKISDVTRIRAYPLRHQTAHRFAGDRVALVGEAAHVMPPIGAQGLNLGLRDVAALRDALEDAQIARGALDRDQINAALDAYHAARRVDIRSRMAAVGVLNSSLLSGFIGAQAARSIGLHAAKAIAPLRRILMREGMQPSYATPRLMRA